MYFSVCVVSHNKKHEKKSDQCQEKTGIKSVLTEWSSYHFHLSG